MNQLITNSTARPTAGTDVNPNRSDLIIAQLRPLESWTCQFKNSSSHEDAPIYLQIAYFQFIL